MGIPTWRKIVSKKKIPERPGVVWTPTVDYLTPGRLYQIKVDLDQENNDQKWTPESSNACTADGDPALTRLAGAAHIAEVRIGALIARVGGSTADGPGDKEKVLTFSVGRYCVFQALENPRVGTLFLGVNDVFASAEKLQGNLLVDVYDAL